MGGRTGRSGLDRQTGILFLIAVPFALAALVAVLFIREVPLRTTIERADELSEAVAR